MFVVCFVFVSWVVVFLGGGEGREGTGGEGGWGGGGHKNGAIHRETWHHNELFNAPLGDKQRPRATYFQRSKGRAKHFRGHKDALPESLRISIFSCTAQTEIAFA